MKASSLPGLNIQYPISIEILDGRKTVETRTYKIPDKYKGIPLVIIETPGDEGRFKSRLSGIVIFEADFQYKTEKEFYQDQDRHLVSKESPWRWEDKSKWGWKIKVVHRFSEPITYSGPKGIRFTEKISLPSKLGSELNLFLKAIDKLN